MFNFYLQIWIDLHFVLQPMSATFEMNFFRIRITKLAIAQLAEILKEFSGCVALSFHKFFTDWLQTLLSGNKSLQLFCLSFDCLRSRFFRGFHTGTAYRVHNLLLFCFELSSS
ncbi:unnamed protein product [Haemonchus placei]|uniref:Uncharacterized protein n=1 Tax=Haemonchus placei TaxID=6290 RepID=A0A3P8BBM7_HAEPC|nr:unnamed protein product [Haemonchus placei]